MTDAFWSNVAKIKSHLLANEIKPSNFTRDDLEDKLALNMALATEQENVLSFLMDENKELLKNAKVRLDAMRINDLPAKEKERLLKVLDIGIILGKANNGYEGKKISKQKPKAIAQAKVKESIYCNWLNWQADKTRYGGSDDFAEDVLSMSNHQDENGNPLVAHGTITKNWIGKWNKEIKGSN
ncbi:hypothetical protein ACXX82_19520 [Glaciimonas sp. GNP009]